VGEKGNLKEKRGKGRELQAIRIKYGESNNLLRGKIGS